MNEKEVKSQKEETASGENIYRVQVKVCGITNCEDALACAEAGADLLGFNLYAGSPRVISPALARRIVDEVKRNAPHVRCIGIFVNEDLTDVRRTLDEANFDGAQLHGDESPAYCRALKDYFVIKALRVGEDFNPLAVAEYETQSVLLDAYCPHARGGTGHAFDWHIARACSEHVTHLFLAGGLTPESIGAAIRLARPHGVDVCSGVEATPRQKDLVAVREFIAAAREAELAT
jgi:phosphoribosylanthranilate isomerase